MTNPNLEGGLFIMMLAVAFFFTFYSYKKLAIKAGLRLLSISLFMIVAALIAGGYQVAFTYNSTTTNLQTNDTWTGSNQTVVLPGGTQSSWIAWLFGGFAFLNMILIVKDYSDGAKAQ